MKVAVLGASQNPSRMSYRVISIMAGQGIEVLAIGRSKGKVGNIIIHPAPIADREVHTLTLYLNPGLQEQYYEYIVSLNPQRVIFNPGTENGELAKLLDANHINWENACTLVMLNTNQFS